MVSVFEGLLYTFCLLMSTGRKISDDLCRMLLKLHLKQDRENLLCLGVNCEGFSVSYNGIIRKYGGVKLTTQGQFCSQHEFEMDSEPLSVALGFPFPTDS